MRLPGLDAAHRERKVMKVAVEAPVDDYRDIKVFRRGHHAETVEERSWFSLRKRTHAVTVYDDVVLLVAMKPEGEITSKRERKRLLIAEEGIKGSIRMIVPVALFILPVLFVVLLGPAAASIASWAQ